MPDTSTVLVVTSVAFMILLLVVVGVKPHSFQQQAVNVQNGQCPSIGTQPTKCCVNCAIDLKKFIWVFIVGFIVLGLAYYWARHTPKGAQTVSGVRNAFTPNATGGLDGPLM